MVKESNLKPLHNEIKQLLKQIDNVYYKWVKRDLNYAGILLEHGPDKMKQTVDRN